MGNCCLASDWIGAPSMFRESDHVARKEHTCCECGAKIQPGETYHRVTGIWDGKFDVFKQCEPCADLFESLSDVDCPAYGGLSETYMEFLDHQGLVEYDEEADEYLYPDNHMTRALHKHVRTKKP